MLKSQGLSNRAIAHRLGVSERAIRKLVGPSKPAESAQLAFAGITTGGAAGARRSSAASSGDDADGAGHRRRTGPATRSDRRAADDAEPVPMSLDCDASDRTSIGSSPIWGCSTMPRRCSARVLGSRCRRPAGAAVPGRERAVRISRKLYGEIGPAFYGLRTTLLTLLLMALLRIKRPEHLKEHDPAAFGRLLGLDRAPEVKTLRRRLTRLAAHHRAELGAELARLRVDRRGHLMGLLFAALADIRLSEREAHISLAPLSSPHRTRAAQALCGCLNRTPRPLPSAGCGSLAREWWSGRRGAGSWPRQAVGARARRRMASSSSRAR